MNICRQYKFLTNFELNFVKKNPVSVTNVPAPSHNALHFPSYVAMAAGQARFVRWWLNLNFLN